MFGKRSSACDRDALQTARLKSALSRFSEKCECYTALSATPGCRLTVPMVLHSIPQTSRFRCATFAALFSAEVWTDKESAVDTPQFHSRIRLKTGKAARTPMHNETLQVVAWGASGGGGSASCSLPRDCFQSLAVRSCKGAEIWFGCPIAELGVSCEIGKKRDKETPAAILDEWSTTSEACREEKLHE